MEPGGPISTWPDLHLNSRDLADSSGRWWRLWWRPAAMSPPSHGTTKLFVSQQSAELTPPVGAAAAEGAEPGEAWWPVDCPGHPS